MAWLNRVLDYMPDMMESAGGAFLLAGAALPAAGMILGIPALCIASLPLSPAGAAGPILTSITPERTPLRSKLTPEQEAAEDPEPGA